jgi:predicted Zn-dependent protease
MGFTSWLARTGAGAKFARDSNTDADRVRRIGRRLLTSVGSGTSSTPGWPCRVTLVNEETANAFCWKDGTVSVNRGLLELLNPTDDELAFVIGHEMAHAIQRHGSKQAIRNALLSLGTALTDSLFGRRAGEWVCLFGHLACLRTTRGQEIEADLIGMCIAADAGFDPQAALTFLEKAASPGTQMPFDWLSTHPLTRQRLNCIRAKLTSTLRGSDLKESLMRVLPDATRDQAAACR